MAVAGEGGPILQVKHQVLGSLCASLPCFSLGGHKLPRVTVSHHDTELPFTPSFIEPPSAVWPSDSSWDSEDGDEAAGDATELQPGFPPEEEGEPALNPGPFGIPRTSSLAKAKRPSVSFAQGTRFGPQSPQGATEPLRPPRKPRGPWGRPTPESQEAGAPPVEDRRTRGCCYENVGAAGSQPEDGCPEPPASEAPPGGAHKARLPGSRQVAQRAEALEAASKPPGRPPGLTTIYVTVGTVGGGEGPGKGGPGPAQTLLKRLGSFQRPRAPPGEDPRPRRALEGLQKPPRRALGAGEGAPRLPGPEEEAAQESGTRGPGAGEGQVEAKGPWPPGGEGVGSPGRPETGSGGAAKQGEGEPKYQNVAGWSGGF